MKLTRRQFNLGLSAAAASLAAPAAAALPSPAAAPLFDFAIAGGHHHGLVRALATLAIGDALELRREPDNPYDANAVAVYDSKGLKLGFLPRRSNPPVAKLMDEGRSVTAEIVGVLNGEEDEDGLAFTDYGEGEPRVRLSARPA